MKRLSVGVVVAFVALFTAPALAAAQEGYPGTTTTTPPQPTRERVNAGQFGPSDMYLSESCGFQDGTETLVSWNTSPAGMALADGDGCVTVEVQFIPTEGGTANDCADARVNGLTFDAQAGANDLAITGTGANGAAREYIHQLVLRCRSGNGGGGEVQAASANGAGGSSGTGGGTGVLGAELARSIEGESTGGLLPRTGAALVRWVAVGLLLIAVGALALAAERRRLTRRTV